MSGAETLQVTLRISAPDLETLYRRGVLATGRTYYALSQVFSYTASFLLPLGLLALYFIPPNTIYEYLSVVVSPLFILLYYVFRTLAEKAPEKTDVIVVRQRGKKVKLYTPKVHTFRSRVEIVGRPIIDGVELSYM